MSEDRLSRSAAELAAAAGMKGEVRLTPMPGGRNNRAYKLEADGRTAFLKAYFRHPDDPRDRLRSETELLAHAETLGIKAVTRVLAKDAASGMALFDFVPGRRLAPGEVDAGHVEAAARLYLDLNARPASLSDASEACFSPARHVDRVDRRMNRLARAASDGLVRSDGADFVRGDLAPAWEALRTKVLAATEALPGGLDAVLPANSRRISPSDFGFHNALLTPSGNLVFVDFEYAGMDDPAKLVCDFFCQPEVPVDQGHFRGFLDRVAQASPEDPGLPGRARLLLPVYGIKWCCIMLNEFLPLGSSRRDFAGDEALEPRRDRQLVLVRHSLTQYLKYREIWNGRD